MQERFLAWPDISNFHNLRKEMKDSSYENGITKYFAKIKLDGTNAAIHISSDGVFPQSRSKIISVLDDNMGFAKWVSTQESAWKTLTQTSEELIIFGEWAGEKIQKGVAISKIGKKIFAVFCVVKRTMDTKEITFLVDPEEINRLLGTAILSDVYTIPWYTVEEHQFTLMIDWSKSAEELQLTLEPTNQAISAIEECDPWVFENFGIKGVGEGLVCYPETTNWSEFCALLFKAKGEKHKTVRQELPAQVLPPSAETVQRFAELVITDSRLSQGAYAVTQAQNPEPQFSNKTIGLFLQWVEADLIKETQAELQASGLTWKQVRKSCLDLARKWYIERC